MKIRSRWLLRPFALVLAIVARLWMSTLRSRLHAPPGVVPPPLGGDQRYIYAFWHEYMALPLWFAAQGNVHVLISRHTDGDLAAEALKLLRFSAVRGSTTRGGVSALQEMKQVARRNHLAITPDGPRGPRRVVQIGLIFTASVTGLPIVPVGMASAWNDRARSWDRFCVPYPNSQAAGVLGQPIYIPPDLTRAELEHYRQVVQDALDRATEQAEAWLATGQKPLDLDPEQVSRLAA